jgi:hypothetical protein
MLEGLATPTEAGRSAEPIDGKGIDPALREPKGELLVERMEAAYVGEDDHTSTPWPRRQSPERSEAVAIRRDQLDQSAVKGTTCDLRDRRAAVVVEAH